MKKLLKVDICEGYLLISINVISIKASNIPDVMYIAFKIAFLISPVLSLVPANCILISTKGIAMIMTTKKKDIMTRKLDIPASIPPNNAKMVIKIRSITIPNTTDVAITALSLILYTTKKYVECS
jgi:hypothetical protein